MFAESKKLSDIPMLRVLIFTSLLMLTANICWAKSYRWVDAEGNTHLSQKPPPNDVKVKSRSTIHHGFHSRLMISHHNGFFYCDSLKLAPTSADAVTMLFFSRRILKEYSDYQIKYKKLAAQLRQENGSQTEDKDIKKIKRDAEIAECAVSWAREQKNKLAPLRAKIIGDAKSAQSNFDIYVKKRDRECWAPTPGTKRQQQCLRVFQKGYDEKLKRLNKANELLKKVE